MVPRQSANRYDNIQRPQYAIVIQFRIGEKKTRAKEAHNLMFNFTAELGQERAFLCFCTRPSTQRIHTCVYATCYTDVIMSAMRVLRAILVIKPVYLILLSQYTRTNVTSTTLGYPVLTRPALTWITSSPTPYVNVKEHIYNFYLFKQMGTIRQAFLPIIERSAWKPTSLLSDFRTKRPVLWIVSRLQVNTTNFEMAAIAGAPPTSNIS